MMRVLTVGMLAGSGILTGCASEAEPTPPITATYSDPQCFAIARSRAADAGANGWRADVQGRVLDDSYDVCRRMKSASTQ